MEVSEVVSKVKIDLDRLFDKLKVKNEPGLKPLYKYFQEQLGWVNERLACLKKKKASKSRSLNGNKTTYL
jgi:hypothetical protein